MIRNSIPTYCFNVDFKRGSCGFAGDSDSANLPTAAQQPELVPYVEALRYICHVTASHSAVGTQSRTI